MRINIYRDLHADNAAFHERLNESDGGPYIGGIKMKSPGLYIVEEAESANLGPIAAITGTTLNDAISKIQAHLGQKGVFIFNK